MFVRRPCHAPVAVGPIGAGRVELEESVEQHRGYVGHAHGHAGMTRIGGLNRVHGEGADGIGHDGMGRGLGFGAGSFYRHGRKFLSRLDGMKIIARLTPRGKMAIRVSDVNIIIHLSQLTRDLRSVIPVKFVEDCGLFL